MNIRKAIIPAAGYGTRMLPAAKAVPKELLPILDRPVIQYVVEEAATAGIEDVLLVTSRDKRAIEDHFDRNSELEARLKSRGQQSLLDSIADLAAKVQIHAVRQPEQRGLGDAVYQARRHVGDESFLCLLGDTIFSGDILPSQQLLDAYAKLQTPIIGLEEVPLDKVGRYGIVGGTLIAPGLMRLNSVTEKPSKESAPSRLAIAARYILTPDIFDCLHQTKPGAGGEIQLTDAISLLLQRQTIHGVILNSKRHDIGNPLDWLQTNIFFAARRPDVWSQLAPSLRSLLNESV